MAQTGSARFGTIEHIGMYGSVYVRRLIGLGVLLAVLILIWTPQLVSVDRLLAQVFVAGSEYGSPYLQIHFLDVGQGDAVLIHTPDDVQLLVDGGLDRRVLNRLGEVLSPLDRQIDMIIGTHPHADHIGGLVDVLHRFTVDHILITENRLPTEVSDRFFAAVEREAAAGAQVYNARAGQVFRLGASTTVHVRSPRYDATDMDADASSVVVQVRYGDTAVMLTGDAPIAIEDYLVEQYGSGLASDILKLGHHGSRTSSGPLFLDAVSPEYGVTSAGRDSRHGHPHEEVVERVLARGITHVTTQTAGTITFKSDGTSVWLRE